MNKTFLYGTITGVSALALAVPVFAQVSSGASSASTTSTDLPAPSQACILALAEADAKMLATIDAMTAAHKAATQARMEALKSAAAIADDAQRRAAVQKANEDMRAAMEAVRPAGADETNPMAAVKEECGDTLHGLGGPMFMMKMGGRGHHGPEMLAEKLGMTADELKAALDSGKTIEQIAEENGIELPARPMMKMMKMRGFRGDGMFEEEIRLESSTSATTSATTQQ